jgi:predicted kinase
MSKILTILRGLPGSGKSTAIRNRMQSHTTRPLILSADHYFMQNGVYCFDPSKLGAAHAHCQTQCVHAMSVDTPWIVIDNTHTQAWEYQLVCALARVFNYHVEFVDLYDGGCSDEELARRNIHGVSQDQIARMRARYER